MSEPSPTPPAKHADALPLPGWLTKIYYVFPVVLYVPDMIFNFFVYSDGSGLDFNNITILSIPQLALWGFLSAGIVGMAWLLSVLAPWHWARGNRFQSMMCWFGVVLATSITMWNSLAYRSEKFKSFKTDSLFGTTNISSFSLTMIIVALAPPFWGLFWAIVQPAQPKRSAEAERESHQQRLERLKQEAEIKQVKAAANAQIRAAQISGFAATARAARAQLGAAMSGNETAAPPMVEGSITVEEEAPPAQVAALPAANGRVVRLLPASDSEEFLQLIAGVRDRLQDAGITANVANVINQLDADGYAVPAPEIVARAFVELGQRLSRRASAANDAATQPPRPRAFPPVGSAAYATTVYSEAKRLLQTTTPLTYHNLATFTGQKVDDVIAAIQALQEARIAKRKPGKQLTADPVLDVLTAN